MNLFELVAIIVSLTAVLSYINYRFIGLPTTIGITILSLVMSLLVILLGELGVANIEARAVEVIENIDFNKTLLHGMLSFLLFAGALHVNLQDLQEYKWPIAILATFGVLVSTIIIGTCVYWLLLWLNIPVNYAYCLVFGALISPTDPIAVLAIFQQLGAPKEVQTVMAGESLFNDGVGVVVFLVMLGIATGGEGASAIEIVKLFSLEAFGGCAFGLLIGYVGYFFLKGIDNYQVEALITLAVVTGGYALAENLEVSAPIAIVVAGILIGNKGRMFAMSDMTRKHLDDFWELIDEVLNAVLFMLIGVEILIISLTKEYLAIGLMVIPIVLFARWSSVAIPMLIMNRYRTYPPFMTSILTWGGLRGGISVALALSLPSSPAREPILIVTYAVVLFAILVQGLTIKKLLTYSQQ